MTVEDQEAALVARHQVIGLAAFGQGQQKIVSGIGRSLHARQRRDILGELPDLVDQAAGLVWFDEFGHRGFCSVERSSSTCVAQVRSVNFPSSHLLMIAAGLPAGTIRADTMMLVSMHHAHQALSAFSWCGVRADLADRFVDDALNFIGVGVGIARPDVLHGALKHAPVNGILDEFREIAFFTPWEPRNVRRFRSVSFETLRLQRDRVFSIWHLCVYVP